MKRSTQWLGRAASMSILALTAWGRLTAAQISPDDSAFIASAKRAAIKYRVQEAAIADGFRPVGVEFPAMGEHWVSLQRVMANTIDPALPSVLIYVTVNGRPTLGGVGYTDLLRPGEPLPRRPAAGSWHEHNGSIAEESLPLRHQMGAAASTVGDDGLRLAILHLWTEIPNDVGPFATDNWRLPQRRLDDRAPHLGAEATRALALAQDETGYYALMLRVALQPSGREEVVIDHVLADARATAIARAAALRSAMSSRAAVSKQEASLADAWNGMWRVLDGRLPGRRNQLHALREELTGVSAPIE